MSRPVVGPEPLVRSGPVPAEKALHTAEEGTLPRQDARTASMPTHGLPVNLSRYNRY